jgi:hypothetical protein
MVELRPLPILFAIKEKNIYRFYRTIKDTAFNKPVNTVLKEDNFNVTIFKTKAQHANTNLSLVKNRNIYAGCKWAYTNELLLTDTQQEFVVLNLISCPQII